MTSCKHLCYMADRNLSHGYPFLPMLRSDLIEILYKNLEGRDTKIKTSSEVVDIELDDEAAHVRLSDGSTIDGSIVIGADGVHSTTRKLMHKLARTVPRPMASSFYGLFGRAYPPPDLPLEPEVFFESRGAGAVIQCLGNGERLQFVTLKPLPGAPSAGRARYSAEDVESYASSIADVAVCPGVRFGDVWAHVDRTTVRMLNQEEGFMDRWHHGGRVVLVGDAVHKSTSVNGLGMTCGLHSAAALSNLLQGLLRDNQTPSAEDFGEVFARYQRDREREVKPVWDAGYAMIREVTRTSWASWFWDRFVLPWLDTEQLARGLIPSAFLIRYGQVLSYLPFSGEQGRVPWVHRADPLL